MTNITETAEWSPSVMLLDTTTPVLGGPEGPSNTPLKQLTNRTAYLKGEVESRSLLSHIHAITGVTGLQAALDGKASVAHTHAQADITGLAASLAGKSDTGHVHVIAGVTGLQAALDGKSPTSHTHTPASLGAAAAAHSHAVSDVTNLQTQLDGKASTAHAHIIGNVTGLDAALTGKAPTNHTHTTGNVTGLDAALAGKAPTAHTHVQGDVTGLAAFLVPTGCVMPFAGAAAPSGWLACDGSAISRATYAALFAAIGTTWGAGDGTTTFNLPDLRGRSAIGSGQGPTLTDRPLGQKGGQETHVLAETEMPSHTHSYLSGGAVVSSPVGGGSWTGINLPADNPRITGATGGGSAHNNMPPWAALFYVIKT